MLKKIVVLFIILIAFSAQAQTQTVVVVGGGVPAAAGCAADTLTIGDDDPSGASTAGTDAAYLYLSGYVAAETCTIDRIEVDLSDAGSSASVRVAVYADSGGSPTGSKLAQSAAVSTTAGDGNPETLSIDISPAVSMTATTRYWIAVWANNTTMGIYHNGDVANGTGYQESTYNATNDFPDISSFNDWNKQFVVSGYAQ